MAGKWYTVSRNYTLNVALFWVSNTWSDPFLCCWAVAASTAPSQHTVTKGNNWHSYNHPGRRQLFFSLCQYSAQVVTADSRHRLCVPWFGPTVGCFTALSTSKVGCAKLCCSVWVYYIHVDLWHFQLMMCLSGCNLKESFHEYSHNVLGKVFFSA